MSSEAAYNTKATETTQAAGPSTEAAEFPSRQVAEALADAKRRLSQLHLGDEFAPEAAEAIVASGLHRLTLPSAEGGLGARLAKTAYVQAALGAIDGSTALGFAMHAHVTGTLVEAGGWPDEARARLLGAIVNEGALVNAASTEEEGGSPARGAIPKTMARRDRNCYRLNGEKTWTTWLPALRFALVSAQLDDREAPGTDGQMPPADDEARHTDGQAPGADGPTIGTFLVDLDLPGVVRLPAFDALGMRGSASGQLRLVDVEVSSDSLVLRREPGTRDPRGPVPQAWFAMCIAATYLGIGEGARDEVAHWAISRRPGDGSTSVADLPTVQVRLGRLDAALRGARLVLFDVAQRWDRTKALERTALMPDIMLAKLLATNAAVSATDEALRIAGGPGFLAGKLERAFRDARAGLINPPLDDIAYQEFAKAVISRMGQGG